MLYSGNTNTAHPFSRSVPARAAFHIEVKMKV